MTDHTLLLGLAGRVPDGWLALARATVARGDHGRFRELCAALARTGLVTVTWAEAPHFPGAPVRDAAHAHHDFDAPEADDHPAAELAAATDGVNALWRARRDGADTVYLSQAEPGTDLADLAAALQHALGAPVEVFDVATELPAYHRAALAAARLVWADWVVETPARRLVAVPPVDDRQALLDFLGGRDCGPTPARTSTLDRHRVRAASAAANQEVPLWQAG
ncbi:hypothetical protein [Actinokineospora sp. NBRC 105648]|uniref:hypothetical protein n=1 Tax=Actinokineospora sp. NBRC 105648 TaxID=3032206 RepID=UPI0024A5A3A2|nr:hypothetical protein [Actinokineospora sp. NBRC 105648]GLZ38949.1 hypothetical protein Acsp05_25730 [Actinokineospora sp. NBRC 105648]